MADSIEQLGFELTAGVLSEQERAASSLRASAGTVLGAASIAESLLAVRLGRHGLDASTVLATVSYGLCFATGIWVLLPRDLALSFSGAELMGDGDRDRTADVAEAYRAASQWIEPYVGLNRQTIERLANWLAISCLLLLVEVISCTIGLTS
jgi:hypothetical protein